MGKKELIYKTAIKVIAREGFNNMKIQMVADEAQVAVGTIYLHFNNKDDILNTIISSEHQKRINFLDQLEGGSQSALEKLKAFLKFHFDSLMCDMDVGKILVQEVALLDMPLHDEVIVTRTQMQDHIRSLIVKAQEEGTVRKSDPKILMGSLLNMTKGLMYSLLRENNADEYTRLKEGAVDFLINGIRV